MDNVIRDIRCRKCGNVENIYINVENHTNHENYSRVDTFFCKSCEQLSTIDTAKNPLTCQKCRSKELTKFFSENKVKCSKCGTKSFDVLREVL